MARYGDNIRRIAQTDDLLKQIRQAEQKIDVLVKASIPGSRAIAYPDGQVQTGSPGATAPNKNGSPKDSGIYPKKDPISEGGVDDKTTDGDSIIKGSVNLQKGDDVGAIKLKDCDSGERIDVRFNTGANEGEAKFKHPEGWGTTGPGDDSSYLAGHVWTLSSGGVDYFSNNFNGLLEEFKAAAGWLYCYTISGGLVFKLVPSPGDALIQFTNTARTVGQAPIGGVQYAYTSSTTAVGIGQYGRIQCGIKAGDTSACNAEPPPRVSSWQQDVPGTPHQLAFSTQDGGFVSSKWDEGIPLRFKNTVGSGRGLNNLRLCTEEGNKVEVSALTDGTFAYFEEDGFGQPKEDAKIFHFNNSGKYLDQLNLNQYNYLKSTNNPGA